MSLCDDLRASIEALTRHSDWHPEATAILTVACARIDAAERILSDLDGRARAWTGSTACDPYARGRHNAWAEVRDVIGGAL